MIWALMFVAFLVAVPASADAPGIARDVAENISAIRANDGDLRDDAFAKMGGSSVESRAFLHCFATPYADLGQHDALGDAVEYFNAPKRDSFSRTSLAAGVSWNLRYVLGGRPAKFRQEIAETKPRWALVLFGGNDSQNRNERIYARRLVYLVEELVELGVVPVLGSSGPRRARNKDQWVQRFNAITEAIATHWRLPYVDYYSEMVRLPNKGLAADGVHPNVYGRGGVRAACQLTEEGLRYGNNVRNLLTLQTLHSLMQLSRSEHVMTDTLPLLAQMPTPSDQRPPERYEIDVSRLDESEVEVSSLPFSAVVDKSRLDDLHGVASGCSQPGSDSKGMHVRLQLEEKQRLRANAIDLDGHQARLYWVRVSEAGERCLKRRSQVVEVAPGPGTWDLIVEVPAEATSAGDLMLLINRESR